MQFPCLIEDIDYFEKKIKQLSPLPDTPRLDVLQQYTHYRSVIPEINELRKHLVQDMTEGKASSKNTKTQHLIDQIDRIKPPLLAKLDSIWEKHILRTCYPCLPISTPGNDIQRLYAKSI